MAGITYFVALPFDVADGSIVVGEPRLRLGPTACPVSKMNFWIA
jgi:hypothetical protein